MRTKHASTKFDRETRSWVFDEEKARSWWPKARIDEDGIVRWKSNDSVPFPDMLYDFRHLGFIDETTERRSTETRNHESGLAIERYRKQRAEHGYSDEEMFEMRAAFGPGEEVIDILTGKKFVL